MEMNGSTLNTMGGGATFRFKSFPTISGWGQYPIRNYHNKQHNKSLHQTACRIHARKSKTMRRQAAGEFGVVRRRKTQWRQYEKD
jgi:hypothetical protein